MVAVFQRGFTAAMVAGLVLLIVYQVLMLWWTKRTTGTLPTPIIVLRGINIAILLIAGLFIALWLMRG